MTKIIISSNLKTISGIIVHIEVRNTNVSLTIVLESLHNLFIEGTAKITISKEVYKNFQNIDIVAIKDFIVFLGVTSEDFIADLVKRHVVFILKESVCIMDVINVISLKPSKVDKVTKAVVKNESLKEILNVLLYESISVKLSIRQICFKDRN